MSMMLCCPFCLTELDHANRCANTSCFMWFTLVPLPQEKEVEYEVRNMAGEVIFRV